MNLPRGVTSIPKPCFDAAQRSSLDIVGKVNDLLLCYLGISGELLSYYLPLALVGLLLLVVMALAAHEVLKD